MQLKYLLVFLPLLSIGAKAQNVPNLNQTVNPGTFTDMQPPPEVAIGVGLTNSVTTYVPVLPIADAALIQSGSPAANVKQQVVYLDGFQRPYQSISKNVSNVSGVSKHLVQIYDNRPLTEQYSFLPYASNNANLNTNAFAAQKSYYQNLFPLEGYSSFSKTMSSSSPVERSATSYAPGRAQVGLGYGSVTRSVTNPASQVIIWDVDANGVPFANGYYAAGTLIGTEAADPDASGANFNVSSPKARVYADKDGKTILKLVADSSYTNIAGNQVTTGTTYTYTYYVYDAKGNLRCTITPKAFKYYQSQGSISATILNNLCFQYQYDAKGRQNGMKKPGEDDFTYVVYDRKDRPVMRQTPKERAAKEWEIIFMDALGRTKVTSIYTDVQTTPLDRNGWQNAIDTWTIGGNYAALLNYLVTPAMESQYPVGSNPTADPANNAYSAILNNSVMTISYYDDYTAIDPSGTLFAVCRDNVNLPLLSTPGAEVPAVGRAYGLPTGTIIRILRSPSAATSNRVGDWRSSVVFYDDKGRSIYSKSYVRDNMNGGTIINTDYNGTQYDFADRPLLTGHVMINQNSAGNVLTANHTEYSKFQYDAVTGALLNIKHNVDGPSWITTSSYQYDDMGRLARKTLGSGGEVQQMTYNIRGQLAGINGTYAETGYKGGYSKTFGESLKYDYGFSKPRYDGKLAGMVWRGSSATDMYAYGYDYTQNGALKKADFSHQESGNWARSTMDYTVSNLFYDKNGNMTDMKQRGVKPGTGPVDMDVLHYTYEAGDISNRLAQVTEQSTAGNYNAGDFQGASATFSYDANGNASNNTGAKLIRAITYTRFNKPLVIAFTNGSSIEYSYDAMGNKVEELYIDNAAGKTKRTDYIGNAVYQNTYATTAATGSNTDSLLYLMTVDGRTTFNFNTRASKEEFFVKDHLGNIRSVINVSGYELKTYMATYEVASAHLENLLFDNIDPVRAVKPGGSGDDVMAANLNGVDPSRTIGTSLLMHVMAGDKVGLSVNTLFNGYDSKDDVPLNPDQVLSQLVGTLSGGEGGLGKSEWHNEKLVPSLLSPENYLKYNDLLQSATDESKPRAYLNYMLFDENMRLSGSMSGAFQATGDGGWAQIGTTSDLEVPINGYLAVYISNTSVSQSCTPCSDVYFDRLAINLSHGNLLEENHYYPHGLPIFGLGSRTTDVNYKNNRQKYQSNEYITDQGLNWMSFGARQYDPQIGRFLSVDPMAASWGQESYSPYAAMGNQPESNIDPNGLGPQDFMLAQAVTPDSGDPSVNIKYAQSLMMGGNYSGAGANYHGGGSSQAPNFPPGFHAAGMGGVALNTFWNILPAAVQDNVNAQYESYANRRTAKGQSNSSGYQFGSIGENGEFVMTYVAGRPYNGGTSSRESNKTRKGAYDWLLNQLGNISNVLTGVGGGIEGAGKYWDMGLNGVSKFTKVGKVVGKVATVAAKAALVVDAYNVIQGKTSQQRFAYHVGSLWLSSEIGAGMGGPYGAAAGLGLGLGEIGYDELVVPYVIEPAGQKFDMELNSFMGSVFNFHP